MAKEVEIDFNYVDADSDTLTVTHSWSTGGGFMAATLLTGDPSHTLPAGGTFTGSPGGDDYVSVWDARTDLGQGYAGNATVRTTIDDGTVSVDVDQVVALTNNVSPNGSVDSIVQRQVDSNLVDCTLTLTDADSDNITVTLEYSTTGPTGSYSAMTLATGDPAHTLTTPVPAVPGGITQVAVWDAKADLPVGFDGMACVRMTFNDGAGDLDVNTCQTVIHNTAPVISSVNITLRP